MKTSVIKYRVADFLKRYPPFSEIDDLDLLDLAASGRVVFHESDEYVFQKDDSRGSVVWVIQQGRVHLLEGSDEDRQLKDILGEGDMLGLGRFLGHTSCRYSARTASDVILYSIDAAAFETVAKRNPAVSRYLAAHFSISERYAESNGSGSSRSEDRGQRDITVRSWLDASGPDLRELGELLVTVETGATVRQAARRMQEANSAWIAATDGGGKPLGLLGCDILRNQIAGGEDFISSTVEAAMSREFVTVQLQNAVSDYFLEMLAGRSTVLAVTEDGTRATRLLGVVDASHLSLYAGWNPALLVQEIVRQGGLTDCSRFLAQSTAIVEDALVDPAGVDQSARIASELLDALMERLIGQAQRELAIDGPEKPALAYCWLVFGRSARGESFPFRQPWIGVCFADASEQVTCEAKRYFSSVLKRVAELFSVAGLTRSSDLEPEDISCRSIAEWGEYFASRIADPIGQAVYSTREFFDFRPLRGETDLARDLQNRVILALESSDSFIPVLANDTMSNLPPLTFFQGLVIELDGAKRETLDLEKTLLDPISDAARVFGYASGDLSTTNTLRRLAQAVTVLPKGSSVLLEAAEAFRMASYQIARASLQAGVTTALIRPSTLSRYDQRRLKTAFSSIQDLLELTATAFY
ncbi:MAG: putative nucleotidyltransferase substrate binding domain-containing protein [Acidobacteriota bacterium]